jgi:c-di-AMP phosphodiesterase-like protein
MPVFMHQFYQHKKTFFTVYFLLITLLCTVLFFFSLIKTSGLIFLITLFIAFYMFFVQLFTRFSQSMDRHIKKIQQTLLENIPKGIMITNANGLLSMSINILKPLRCIVKKMPLESMPVC